MIKRKIRRGDVYIANLDPVVGSEQGGERPVLIVQNNVGNTYSPTVIVLAITSHCQKKKSMPTHISIESSGLSVSSIALAEQVRTVDRRRLIRYVGRVSKATMDDVNQALKISMGIE